jgi:hypothetical protein
VVWRPVAHRRADRTWRCPVGIHFRIRAGV